MYLAFAADEPIQPPADAAESGDESDTNLEPPETVSVTSGSGRKKKTVTWRLRGPITEDTRTQSKFGTAILGVPVETLRSFRELDMYLHLLPGQLEGVKEMVVAINKVLTPSMQKFTLGEYFICLGINLMASVTDGGYRELFRVKMRDQDLMPAPMFGIRFGVARDRFELWRRRCKLTDWAEDNEVDPDPWKPMSTFWRRFNKERPTRIAPGWKVTYDELMQAWKGMSL